MRTAGLTLTPMLLALCLCLNATQAGERTGRVVFHLPFDGDLIARTPEREVEPATGALVVDDMDINVTIGELAQGPKALKLGGGKLSVGSDPRIQFVDGLSGKAVRLRTRLAYPAVWLKNQEQGTITLWYRNPRWRVQTWRVPAMLTTAQWYRAKTSEWQTPISWWIFDRLTAPPERGNSRWFHWFMPDFNEHPRNLLPRAEDDDAWHFWAFRWDRKGRLLEVIDDDQVRDISKYDTLVKPGEDYWEETYRGRTTKVYEDVGHIKFEEIFLGEIHLARYCQVTLDEVYVWDRAAPRDEILAAYRRGRAGQETWPSAKKPEPRRRLADALDLSRVPKERPPLPKEVQWDDQGAFIVKTATQQSTCLNGYWRFQPANDLTRPPSASDWGYVRIPGDWGGKQRVFDEEFRLLKDKKWGEKPLTSYRVCWFERDISIPAEQKGRRFFLRYDRYDRDLTTTFLYVNGQFVRRIRSYGPTRADVTQWVRPGQMNRIAIALEGKSNFRFDLYLDSRQLEAISVHDIYVIPEYRRRAVTVQFEIENHTNQKQVFPLGAEFFEWKKGGRAHSIPGKTIEVEPGARLLTSVRGPWANPHCWSVYDPFLYTAQVVVRDSKGQVVDRSLPVRFGYREVWCERGWLLMNGSKLHIRGMGHGGGSVKGTPADFLEARLGVARFIIFHKQVNNNWNRGTRPAPKAYLEVADELGSIATLRMPSTGYRGESDWTPDPQSQLQATGLAKWLRNHPSLVTYIVRQDVPYDLNHQWGANHGMYLEQFENDPKWELADRVWNRFVEPFRRVHPTALFHGMWRPYGDMAQIGSKPGYGQALQNREELPRFAAGRDKAIWNAECGWPQISRYAWDAAGQDGLSSRYKKCWGNLSQVTEELAAMYLGDEAYDQDAQLKNGMGPNWRTVGEGRFDWEYVKAIQTVGPPYSRKFAGAVASPGWNKLRMLFGRRNIAAWRWQGYGYWLHTEHNQMTQGDPRYVGLRDEAASRKLVGTGLRRPGIYWDDGYVWRYRGQLDRKRFHEHLPRTELGDVVEKAQRPVVAWVFGWPDPLRKDHAYYEGEIVRKQIAVMNEYPWPTRVTVRWFVDDLEAKSTVARGQATVEFATGDQRLFPIEFLAPNVKGKRRCRIRLETVVDGQVVHDDALDIQVFPQYQPLPPSGSIALLATPSTANMLQTAGIPFTPVQEGTDLSRYGLLIIGRGCDHERARQLLRKLDIQEHLADGLSLLIFEQEGEVLERPDPDPWPPLSIEVRRDRPELLSFGLRQDRRSARYVFIRDRQHPLFEGLGNEDFANWRGASNLIQPYTREKWHGGPHSPRRFRRPNHSNLGDVATYVLEKPHGGNFVSLLDTQFDLLYSALLEERRPNGKTLYCQLNVTNRCEVDPVATLMVHRLIRYAMEKSEPLTGQAAFLGGKLWRHTMANVPFDLPDLKKEAGPAALDGVSALVVGLGIPKIDEYDEAGEFVGVHAAPAMPLKDNDAERAALEDAPADTTAAGEGADVPLNIDPKRKKPRYIPAKGEEKLAYAWLLKHRAAIEKFVAEGGAVLILPVQNEKELSWLPFQMGLKPTKVFAARPNDVFQTCRTIGPADLYWRRALEIPLPAGLPEGSRSTTPAVLARVPCKKGEFIFTQVQPKLFTGHWPEAKIIRLLSAILTEKGITDRLDLDLRTPGYGDRGFPYFGSTLYFDPFLCTNW